MKYNELKVLSLLLIVASMLMLSCTINRDIPADPVVTDPPEVQYENVGPEGPGEEFKFYGLQGFKFSETTE